jgi:drug/metabolite transporter (DMT)-like permease
MKTLYTWTAIAVITVASTAGESLLAHAMQRIGDLGELRRREGILACVRRVFTTPTVFIAISFMAVAFFSLLFGLSWADLSLVGPAAAALTFLTNALAAKFFLKEKVDRRRWIAAVFVGAGVALLAR